MNIYAHNILDHYKHPRHKEELGAEDINHREFNQSCGDDIAVSVKVECGVIKEIKFTGHGCAISQAGISILSDKLLNLPVVAVLAYDFEKMKKIFGVPISDRRRKCALIGLIAIQKSLLKL